MILPAQMIRARGGMILPFHERDVAHGMSFGLSAAGYDVRIDQDVAIEPGGFALASTMECFQMPNDVLGIVHDKSSWARRGLAVQNTVLEPGWRGFLTLELTNHNPAIRGKGIVIVKGSPIAQIVFHQLAGMTELPYGGKYQDQERGPQDARYE